MNFTTQGTSALAPIETFSPVLVQKPAPVAVGSIISYRWQNKVMGLPILQIKRDRWNHVSQYVTPSPFPDGVFMTISATNTQNIQSISEAKPIEGKTWYLLAALDAAKNAGRWMKHASRHKPLVFSLASLQVVETRNGFGFHDEIETDLDEGDSVAYGRRMKKAQEWQAVYFQLIEMYKAA